MSEYIDREEIRNLLYRADAITMQGVRIINQFPAADVKPVVLGWWEIVNEDVRGEDIRCSVCGRNPHWTLTQMEIAPDFCPNCGADMREAE